MILCFYSSTVTFVWSRCNRRERERERERVHAQERAVGSRKSLRENNFSQNSGSYIVLKLPYDPHPMLVFNRSRLILTQCLFFIGHGLHSANASLSLVMSNTHTMLAFPWSWLTFTQCLFFIACFSLVTAYIHELFSFLVMTSLIFSPGGYIYQRFIAGQGDILHTWQTKMHFHSLDNFIFL